MKENLVQKLDLLEAQLARIEARKVDAARLNRTKHLLERLEKSGNVLPGRNELYDQIRDTKAEIVNRKKFYAESVIKRALKQFVKVEPLRIAKRKKAQEGNPDKLAALEAELALVQSSLDIEAWSHEIVERFMAKRFAAEFTKRPLSTAEINVLARIGKTDAVKKPLAQLEESVSLYMENHSRVNENNREKQAKVPEQNQMEKGKHEEPKEARQTEENDDFTHFSSENDEEENDDENQDEEIDDEEQIDPFFQERIGLPELHQGYISGSDDDDEPEPEKPARRNRRGQRARRKIWEQKFGHRANHILKQEKQERELKEQKEQRKRKREEKQQAFKRQKLEFESKPVHPSWAAQQKLKEQQKAAKFAGKKIQFD